MGKISFAMVKFWGKGQSNGAFHPAVIGHKLSSVCVILHEYLGIGSPYSPKAEALIKLECSDVFFTKI